MWTEASLGKTAERGVLHGFQRMRRSSPNEESAGRRAENRTRVRRGTAQCGKQLKGRLLLKPLEPLGQRRGSLHAQRRAGGLQPRLPSRARGKG